MREPRPTPDTQRYWDGVRAGELRIQRCRSCGEHYFYPRPFCRYCASRDVEWSVASGKARLISYIVNHRPGPGFQEVSPVIALVELEEGPRMMTNIVGIDAPIDELPEHLPMDLRLQVRFDQRGDSVLPVFAPEGSATA
ncbi:Zn-ribbon domain-containing OB-fold protein [Streptomyces sp. NPDC050145]|uniref:Zn-ribbon domain-containing OB-fold protein n=1 Tax=Streptomyces sp. NPDC050145 TaxID=3365602 RepID=UPI00379B954E